MDSLSALPLAGPGVKIEGLLESEPKALRIQLVIQPPSTHRGRHTRAWARLSTHSSRFSFGSATGDRRRANRVSNSNANLYLSSSWERRFLFWFEKTCGNNVRVNTTGAGLGPATCRLLHLQKRILFECSLCLSRVCLGRLIIFIYKWRKKWFFLTVNPTPSTTMPPSPAPDSDT